MAQSTGRRGFDASLHLAQQACGLASAFFLACRRRPQRAALALGILLMGIGAGSFALEPVLEAEPAPTQVTLEQTLDNTRISSQAQALEEQPALLVHATQARSSDTVQTLLTRLGVTDPETVSALKDEANLLQAVQGQTAGAVVAQTDTRGQLHRLHLVVDGQGEDGSEWARVEISREGGIWQTRTEPVVPQLQTRVAAGRLRSSLAADLAGEPYGALLAINVQKILGDRVDFRRDLRRGDVYALVYRVQSIDGQTVGLDRLLAVQLDLHGQEHTALWYEPAGDDEQAGYFLPDGSSLQRAFLSSPLPHPRVTSPFGMRMHPLVHRLLMHTGVDFHARVGTPVATIGDGRVVYAGWQNGYGNVVRVQHPGGFTSVYAHLSRLEVRTGQWVKAGETVALSGNTGTSTGPHLHFEFHVQHKPVNPLTLARYVPHGKPLSPGEKPAFFAATALLRGQLALAAGAFDARLARVD